MATHSNIIAWRIPQTLERGELQSMGHERIRHVLATKLQHSMTKAPAVTSPHNATTRERHLERLPHSLQLEKDCAHKQRPIATKNKSANYWEGGGL